MRELTQLRQTMPDGIADELRLVTERSISRSDAANAEMYLRFALTPDIEVDARLMDFLADRTEAMSISEICQSLGAGGRGYRCVVRALFESRLRKLSSGRINLHTSVVRP
jgi:hypothetical protein